MLIHFLRRISVRRRVVGGFAILLAVLTLSIPVVLVNHLTLSNRVQQLAEVESKSDRLLLLALSRILSSRVNLMRYADDLLPSTSEAVSDVSQATQYTEEVRALLSDPDQKTATANILAGLVSYNTLISEVQNARNEIRSEDIPNLLFNAYRLEFDLEQQIRAVVDDNQARIDAANQTALSNSRQRLAFLIGGYIVLLSLALITAAVVQQSITRPISELSAGIATFRAEHKPTSVPFEGTDELSILAQTFNQITAELSQTLTGLEQRVAERTKALETSAKVSRRLSTILDPKQLVVEVVEQIKSAFDYYHTHIYLLDESSGDLIIAGGTGEAGKTLLAQTHKISRGKGLVGRAADTNTAVLVPDVLQDPDWLPNPLLPETRSEAAVPIAIAGTVMGVLDVQHSETDGLSQDDVALLQSLANQVAIALQNALSYTSVQQRADREARITSIGQKVQSTTSVESALQVTIRELGRTLGINNIRVVLDADLSKPDKVSS